MLGERIGEETGKVTGRRVLPSDGQGPKVETSFQSSGTLLGKATTTFGTYWAVMRADGTLYGEGQGVTMTTDGGAASWIGSGLGRLTAEGGASFRGAIYFQTATPGLARLNSIAGVYEYDQDPNGNIRILTWEWK